MHIRKYDHDYSRRFFMEQAAKGIATAGVLGPLWPMIANSADITKAYPDELMSIDAWSKGKIKTGADKGAAAEVGKLIAQRAIAAGVKEVVFDRGSYMYHGRVKALAEAAREGGLSF